MDDKREAEEVKMNKEENKIEPENSAPSQEQNNIIINIPKNNENFKNSETLTIKPKLPKSDFENHIIKAYRKLIGLDSPIDENNQNKNEKNEEIENSKDKEPLNKSESKINIKRCENEIRLALKSCIETKVIDINKNVLDKMGRIGRHNKINLLFIIGKIYINLMNKDYLFNPSNKNIDMKILISFCNEVISLNTLLKQTYLGNKYNQTLIHFIS